MSKKMKAKVKGSAILSLLIIMTTVTACSNNNKDNTASNANSTTNTSTSSNATENASENTNADANASQAATTPDGPTGKYNPPIEVTTVRSVNSAAELPPGDSLDSNIWVKTFQEDLGINLKNVWKVNAAQYQNKVAVTMASGDMPDFMEVDAQQFQILVEAGTIADLTDAYSTYASEMTKSSMEANNSVRLKAATTKDGKLMGIPSDGGDITDTQLIYIRKDWLANVGLEAPKTMEDVVNIALAFTKKDPDKNGKNDTYGLSLDLNLFNGWSGLDGFFNGYHAYPFNPTKGSATSLNFMIGGDGKAMWADTQPEVKTALGKLADLFKQGAIYPEFSVIDGMKSAELVTSGKVGMSFGAFWVPTWPINNMYKDLGADWGIYPLVSSDDKPALSQSMTGLPSHFYVVSKKAEHPEAPILMLNTYIEKLYGNFDKNYHTVTVDGKDFGVFGLSPVRGGMPGNNPKAAAAVQAARESGDTSTLNDEQKQYFEQVAKFEAGDKDMWAANKLWTADGVFSLLGKYSDNNLVFQSAYVGNPTTTMIAKGPSLRDEEVKMMTSIIMGSKPLDYFDEWAANWLKSGGQEILDEVNASGQVR
ncbi:extracellular solute-binding protein [Paenibacillus sp. CF384]|uniref:extracellular solute-binding protein n=1 Tax=Paenibacillus sp. CF384 TaxID=1884382 RepID=UPI0008992568|nr:extracellular solute-binding protein [Paenibacillus sp. CF384]SDW05002.1 putative aldouronate transport system substrate-binding protein [Paenibacillus sp. CF384]